MRNKNDDPVCVKCQNTADDVDDAGVCDYCRDTSQHLAHRRRIERNDAYDSGRPLDSADF